MSPCSLVHYLAEIDDPRQPKGIRHQQLSTLTILVMAMLCGRTSLKGIARFARAHVEPLAEVIPLPRNKAPSFSTFQRLSRQVDPQQLCRSFNRWMSQSRGGEAIAIDGKSITSTFQAGGEAKQRFSALVSFFGQHSGLISAVGVLENDKRSEIDVVRELIDTLGIERAVFTLDALHCQKKRWPRLRPRATATSSPSSAISPRCTEPSRR